MLIALQASVISETLYYSLMEEPALRDHHHHHVEQLVAGDGGQGWMRGAPPTVPCSTVPQQCVPVTTLQDSEHLALAFTAARAASSQLSKP